MQKLGIGATLAGLASLGLTDSAPRSDIHKDQDPKTTNLEIKATEFNEAMTKIANDLGWRVRTAPAGSTSGARCLSFNKTQDWEGCVGTFKGFETPVRPSDFKPDGYLVYAYGNYISNEYSGQSLFVYPKPIEGLPNNSTNKLFENLLSTFDEQKDVSRKFGFKFPDTQQEFEAILDKGPDPKLKEIGVIGYWALSEEEMSKLGVVHIELP